MGAAGVIVADAVCLKRNAISSSRAMAGGPYDDGQVRLGQSPPAVAEIASPAVVAAERTG